MLSNTLFSINNMFEIKLDTGAKKIKNIPIAIIPPVKGSNIIPAKKPAKEYLLKKKRDKGSDIKDAERFALNNSLKYLWNFEKNFKKIFLPITIEAVNVYVKINPGSRNSAGFKNKITKPEKDIILKIFISK